MPSPRTKRENKLDLLWRTSGKEDAVCEICETLPEEERINYTQLHPHHILGRMNKATRWDVRNRLWVCPTHHTMGNDKQAVQNNVGGWFLSWKHNEDWMSKHRPEDKEYLREFWGTNKKWSLLELDELIEKYKAL
jgi:hypothetical protein